MFVTLEGIDRSGKTTQAALLAEALGPETLLLREPGGTAAGERIRALLKEPSLELDPRAELLLFGAARAQLCAAVIEPAIAAGRDVVCDRFVDSTVAYQGAGRGLGTGEVAELNAIIVGACMPERTILLRVDPRRAAERAGDDSDRFESEGLELQIRVAEAYERIAESQPQRVIVVDGEGDPAEVHSRVIEAVST